ncbi:MAG: PAS domain S-box protein [Cyclobacteriaceae bacterium]|nr:PAS domain S-box protein [Cyclobacteriaceae bacterium]
MNTSLNRQEIMDGMLEGVQILDYNWRYVYVNDVVVQQSKLSRDQLLNSTFLECYPGVEQTNLFQVLLRCMKLRIEEKFENEFEFQDGSKGQFSLRIFPVPEGIAILSLDRTEYHRAVEKFTKANRLHKYLSAINQSIVHLTDDKTLLDNACRVAVEIGLFQIAWVTNLDTNGNVTLTTIYPNVKLEGIHVMNLSDPQMAETPTGRALKTGQTAITNDIWEDEGVAHLRNELMRADIRSMAALPLKKFGVLVGSMGFTSIRKNFFDEQELELLNEAAGDIAFALENYERVRQHKRMEEKVLESEIRFRSLIEKSADVKMLSTVQGEHLYASPSAMSVLGYRWEELQTMKVFDLIHPEDVNEFQQKREAILLSPGAFFSFQHRRKHRAGHWIWCEGTLTNMLHEPGVRALVSNFVDITGKKLVERQLEFDRTNSQALINNTLDLMWSVDKDLNLITANEPFQQMLIKSGSKRLRPGESILRGSQSQEQLIRFREAYQKALQGATFTQLEHGNQPSDYWLEVSYCPITQDSDVVGVACHSRDVTNHKKTEMQLQQSLRQVLDYKYALDVSSIIAITDRQGVITYVNDNFCRISQYSRAELIGKDHRIVNSGKHPREFFRGLWTTISRGVVWKGEIQNRTKSGTFYWVDTTIIPFVNDRNSPYQFMAIRHDITERKLAEENLVKNNQELQSTNSELDRFVYSVSHDLRSPLASILGLVSLVEKESKEEGTHQYARMIRDSIERLDNFIRNILNYSRNNRLEPTIASVQVKPLITEISNLFALSEAGTRIHFEVEVEEYAEFFTDKQRLIIVLENLIGNAIKFADLEKGKPFVRISGYTTEQNLHLEVEDNGIGIELEYLNKIFNMFFRLDVNKAGSGLGLYIVQETLKKLGGCIHVSSDGRTGTCFVIQIPNHKNQPLLH